MFRKNDDHRQQTLFQPVYDIKARLSKLKNHWSSLFYFKIFCNIDEELFSKLYSKNTGRPNTAINLLVGFEILKALFNLPDSQVFDRMNYDATFHNALGIDDTSKDIFSPRTLYYFRYRLQEYELKTGHDLIASIFSDDRDRIIKDLGLKTGLQRIDSVMIGANIKRMSRLTLFHKILSNLVRKIKNNNFEIAEDIKILLKEDEDNFAYHLPNEEIRSTTKTIAYKIYALLQTYKSQKEIIESDEYKLAERLLKEQCNIKEHQHHADIVLKEAKDIKSGSLQNPSDPEATYRKKKEKVIEGTPFTYLKLVILRIMSR